jgi:hypothetical protein
MTLSKLRWRSRAVQRARRPVGSAASPTPAPNHRARPYATIADPFAASTTTATPAAAPNRKPAATVRTAAEKNSSGRSR